VLRPNTASSGVPPVVVVDLPLRRLADAIIFTKDYLRGKDPPPLVFLYT
jgi:hypothetical protein